VLVITPANTIAALLTLIPLLAAAFFAQRVAGCARRLPAWAQVLCPAVLSVPYVLVTCAAGQFRWGWFALYAVLPVSMAGLLWQAIHADAAQHGNWRDFLVLATLGLAVDLRWFEGAWPAHLAIFNKMLLLDAGIYGFIALRQLKGTGFDLRLRLRDAGYGMREVVLYTPLALALGLGLGFLHLHSEWPGLARIAGAWVFTFFFIAVPEELFFRGWLRRCSGCLTSTSGRCCSIGAMCCWLRWRACFMGVLGGRSGAWELPQLPMPRLMRSGHYGLSN
jgi:hypothetical protein